MSNAVSIPSDDAAPESGTSHPPQRIFVTENSEYLCRGDVCVAVRERHTGKLLPGHSAVGKRISAAVTLNEDGIQSVSMPAEAHPGERLHFASGFDDRHDVLTSPLKEVEVQDADAERWSRTNLP